MAINYKDPRYQRKMLSAMANPISNKLGVQQNLTREWAAGQGQWQNQLTSLGLQRDIFDAGMEHAYAKLDFQKEYFDRGMKNAKEASKLEMYGGLGNALIAGIIGKQRQRDVEREYTMRKKLYDKLSSKYGLVAEGVL